MPPLPMSGTRPHMAQLPPWPARGQTIAAVAASQRQCAISKLQSVLVLHATRCAPLARSRPSSSRSRRCLLSPLLPLLLLSQNLLELRRLYLPSSPLRASAHSGSPQLRLRHWCLLLHRTSAAPPSPPCKTIQTRQQTCCSFTMRFGSVAPGRQRPRTVGQEVMPPCVAVLEPQTSGEFLQ